MSRVDWYMATGTWPARNQLVDLGIDFGCGRNAMREASERGGTGGFAVSQKISKNWPL